MSNNHYHLIIVGAGALGSFHAFHALKKGLNVLLLEKDIRPMEATVRNFGQVVPSGMTQGKWQQYGQRSLEIYEELQSRCDISVRKKGTVYLASDETEITLIEELAAINKKRGYNSVILDKEACLEKYPGLRASYCMGGLYFPQEVTVEPSKLIHRLIAWLREKYQLDFRPASLVKSTVFQQDRCFVETSNAEVFTADQVIICNGRDFKNLYPAIFAASDIEVAKLQMMRTSPMPDYSLPGSVLGGLSIRRYESFKECPSYQKLTAAEIPDPMKKYGIHVLFKQAADGSIIIGDSHEYADAASADLLGFDCKQVINDIILQEAQRMFKFPHWNIASQWNGFYAQCKSRDLFMEKADTNIWIITAIGGKGMTASAGLAEATIHKLFD